MRHMENLSGHMEIATPCHLPQRHTNEYRNLWSEKQMDIAAYGVKHFLPYSAV